jgi:hypothetical protein
MTNSLPNDSDGDALRNLVSHGSDLAKPMLIDFAVAVPTVESGKAIAALVSALGFQPDVYHDEETNSWSVYCSKTVVPTYEEVVAIQRQLDDLSRPFGGKSDGWGTFGNGAK